MSATPSQTPTTAQQTSITPPPSTSTSTSEYSASTTNTTTPTSSTTSPTAPNAPTPNQNANLAKTETKTAAAATPPDDGRRNSQGQALPSPTETWKPSFARVQSWNREEFKRSAYVELGEMEEGREKEGKGMGRIGSGFTEGGAGSRKV